MRLLLAQSSVYVPAHGGANKSNQLLLEALNNLGHDCRVIASACGVHACRSRDAFRRELVKRGLCIISEGSDSDVFRSRGIRVRAGINTKALRNALSEEAREFNPDRIIIASEDPGQTLLETALKLDAAPVVYLARTTLALPFGPASPFQSPSKTALLHQVAGIVAVSRYLRDYMRQWAGLDSIELPICPNGPGPFPQFGCYDAGYITIINPCSYKGISIFAALARAFPNLCFAAVPTWGTTESDLSLLRAHSNIKLMDPTDNIDEILMETRVLLVPSLWAEAKANVITEALLRGIPVLASDAGGNAEAMLGLDYLLPVIPITAFNNRVDERLLPTAVIPDQDIAPWSRALEQLLSTREYYESASARARSVSTAMNQDQTVLPFEEYLQKLTSRKRKPAKIEMV